MLVNFQGLQIELKYDLKKSTFPAFLILKILMSVAIM